jgi:hypothetical protein
MWRFFIFPGLYAGKILKTLGSDIMDGTINEDGYLLGCSAM